MEEYPINQRIRAFIKNQNLTIQQFEKKCGFSNGYIRSIRNMPGADKLEAIVRVFPNLNRAWLLTGEGEMLKEPSAPSAPAPTSPTIAELMAIIKSQQETIKSLSDTIRELSANISK